MSLQSLPRRRFLALLAASAALPIASACTAKPASAKTFPVRFSEEEWRRRLTPAQFTILRRKGTERPGSSALLGEHLSVRRTAIRSIRLTPNSRAAPAGRAFSGRCPVVSKQRPTGQPVIHGPKCTAPVAADILAMCSMTVRVQPASVTA
jgi:hypothetical protein